MHQDTLTYEADGITMRNQLRFESASGPRAGVLVFPEAFGLDQHAIVRAEGVAALGYVALACDLHGEAGSWMSCRRRWPSYSLCLTIPRAPAPARWGRCWHSPHGPRWMQGA